MFKNDGPLIFLKGNSLTNLNCFSNKELIPSTPGFGSPPSGKKPNAKGEAGARDGGGEDP